MNKNLFKLTAIPFVAFCSTFALTPAISQTTSPTKNFSRTLTLTGIGEVRATPDMAVIQIGVVRQANTARKAVTLNNIAMQKIVDVVTKAGIENKDIQTSNFSVQPKYLYPARTKTAPQKPPRIIGYTVSNNLAITVRNLPKLGRILDQVVSAGANNIGSIRFSIQNLEPLKNAARRTAMHNAITKAKLYANEAGFILGPIKSVNEINSQRGPRPVYAQAVARASYKQASVPIAQGQQSIQIQINVVWEIK